MRAPVKEKVESAMKPQWAHADDLVLIGHIQQATLPAVVVSSMERSKEDVFLRTLEFGLRLRGWRSYGPGLVESVQASAGNAARLRSVLDAEIGACNTLEFIGQFLGVSLQQLQAAYDRAPPQHGTYPGSEWTAEKGNALLQMAKKGGFGNINMLVDTFKESPVDVLTKANALSEAISVRDRWTRPAVNALIRGESSTFQKFAAKHGVPEKEVRMRDAVLTTLHIRPSVHVPREPGRRGRKTHDYSDLLEAGMTTEECDNLYAGLLKDIGPSLGLKDAAIALGIGLPAATRLWARMEKDGTVNPLRSIRKPDPMSVPEIAAVRSLLKDKQSTKAIAKFLRRDHQWVKDWLEDNGMLK